MDVALHVKPEREEDLLQLLDRNGPPIPIMTIHGRIAVAEEIVVVAGEPPSTTAGSTRRGRARGGASAV